MIYQRLDSSIQLGVFLKCKGGSVEIAKKMNWTYDFPLENLIDRPLNSAEFLDSFSPPDAAVKAINFIRGKSLSIS
jgi:hypothetical protein